jgi:hypothetical protein
VGDFDRADDPRSALEAGIGTDWAMQGCAVAVATQSGLGGATGQGSAELGEQATVP